MRKRNPLLICGYPRSGTTLLRAMLGQHSRIVLVNEPEIILALHRAGYTVESRLNSDQRRNLVKQLRGVNLCRRHLERLLPAILTNLAYAPGEMPVREIYERLLPRPPGDVVWGEKSLNNLFFVPDLLKMYPDALVIHLVRDARAAAASNFQKGTRSNEGEGGRQVPWQEQAPLFAVQAMRWARWMQFAVGVKRQVPAENFLWLRFEDLVDAPRESLGRICLQLGLELEEGMLNAQARRGDPVLASSSAYAHGKIAQDIDRSRARAYEGLPTPLLWAVERHAGPMLQELGYELIRPKLTLWQRWQYRFQWLKHARRLLRDNALHLERRPFRAQAG